VVSISMQNGPAVLFVAYLPGGRACQILPGLAACRRG
jgi:hypothetical protein